MAQTKRNLELPFVLTEDVEALLEKMHTLNPLEAPLVEPALLDPFWAVGDFVNFSGPSGCGKTRLAADVVLAAVVPQREGSALGGLLRFDLEPLRGGIVAIIDGEGNIARWESIIHAKLKAERLDFATADRLIKYMRPSDLGLQQASRWDEVSLNLAKALRAVDVRFLVADTLARLWAPEDINSAAWVQRGLAPFRTACQEYGISALLLSHTKRGKSGDPNPTGPIGSSFQEGQVDGQITLSRLKGRPGLVLTHQKSRRSFWIQQGSKVSLLFKPGLSYEPVEGWQQQWPHECPGYDAEDLEPYPSTRSQVLQILRNKAPESVTRSEIEAQLHLSERAVRKQLATLSAAGQAERVGKGSDTQWRHRGS